MENDRGKGSELDMAYRPMRRDILKGAAGLGAVGLSAGFMASASAAPQTKAQVGGAAAYEQPFPAKGYAFKAPGSPLEPFSFKRRAVGANDVVIDIHYCGVCHSDIHTARGQGPTAHTSGYRS